MVKGKPMYKVRIDNASPLLLNGLAIQGTLDKGEEPKTFSGMSLPPAHEHDGAGIGRGGGSTGLAQGDQGLRR